jgi:hypothetical protein
MMSTQKISIFIIKADQQRPKLVDPGEAALTGETLFVNVGIEQALTPAPGLFAITLVFGNVGDNQMIETDLAGGAGIKSGVGIEVGSGYHQAKPFHGFESGLQMGLQIKSIVPIARDNPGAGDHITLGIRHGQDVAGLGALAPLVNHTFAAFFGDGMATIQVQMRQIQVILDGLDALLPNALQAAIRAPLLKVVVDRLPANLFFSESFGSGTIGKAAH